MLIGNARLITFEPGRIDDPERRRPDPTRAQQILGWQRKVSMEEGLRQSIVWFSQRLTQLASTEETGLCQLYV